MNYQDAVSKILFQLGEVGIRAPEEYINEGIRLAQRVFTTLQKNSKSIRFTIKEPHISGSIAKKTDVIKPDLDLVVRVGNYKPPMVAAKVLKDWEDILLLNLKELCIQEKSIQTNQHSIQFTLQNGIEVDLLPCPDLEPKQLFKIMEENPRDYYRYNTCMVERQVAFVTSHPSNFVHCLIRLVKFWKKSLVGLGKISGGSYLMEIVAVAAAVEEEEKFGKPDIVRAFTRAMDWFCKLDTLKIAFEEESAEKWRRVPANKLTSQNTWLIPKVIGTWAILKRDSFVVDPANPFNDLLACQNPEKIEAIMRFAQDTRKRLNGIMAGHKEYLKFQMVGNKLTAELDILALFRSQPCQPTPTFPMKIPVDFIIGFRYSTTSLCPDMKVRNEKLLKDLDVIRCIEVLKWNLVCAVKSAIDGQPGKDPNQQISDIRDKIIGVIKTTLKTEVADATGDKHDTMHVTLTIPYQLNDVTYAVKASFSWF